MAIFHRIKNINLYDDYTIFIEFVEGVKVKYNIKPLIENLDMFKPLKNSSFFLSGKVDQKGYGLVWSDEIDISCNELWENGQRIK